MNNASDQEFDSSRLQALIFDVDGTLADTERDGHRVAFNLAFREAGLDWEWDEITYGELLQVTGGKERIVYYINKYLQNSTRPADAASLASRLHGLKTVHYCAMVAKSRVALQIGRAHV